MGMKTHCMRTKSSTAGSEERGRGERERREERGEEPRGRGERREERGEERGERREMLLKLLSAQKIEQYSLMNSKLSSF